jgi:hypothetical protein
MLTTPPRPRRRPHFGRPYAAVLGLAAACLLVIPGCEPHDGHDHSHDGHDHGHSHDHSDHDHSVNDPDVLDVAVLTPIDAAIDGLTAGLALQAGGGHLTWRTEIASGEAAMEAMNELAKFCDAVVVDATGGMAGDGQRLTEAIRGAGMRGVRVVVVGGASGADGVDGIGGKAGVDFPTRVVAAEGDEVSRAALIDAALGVAGRPADQPMDGVPAVLPVEAQAVATE